MDKRVKYDKRSLLLLVAVVFAILPTYLAIGCTTSAVSVTTTTSSTTTTTTTTTSTTTTTQSPGTYSISGTVDWSPAISANRLLEVTATTNSNFTSLNTSVSNTQSRQLTSGATNFAYTLSGLISTETYYVVGILYAGTSVGRPPASGTKLGQYADGKYYSTYASVADRGTPEAITITNSNQTGKNFSLTVTMP